MFKQRQLTGVVSTASLLFLACSSISEPREDSVQTSSPIIYGTENREEFGAFDSAERVAARSTSALMDASDVNCVGGTCTLSTGTFTQANCGTSSSPDWQPLCSTVTVRNQAQAAFCSGFLVGPDLMVTAGHCIPDEASRAATRFVFGFNADAAGANPVTSVPANDVYQCATLTRDYTGNGANDVDWAICKLDRLAGDRPVFPIRYSLTATLGAPVEAYGHPDGLPLKHAFNATIEAVSSTIERIDYNLDVFGGNSGSPVLDDRGVAIGIHVTPPALHYTKVAAPGGGTCAAYTVCNEDTGCPGFSRAQRLDRISAQIPLSPAQVVTSVL